jgi:phage terminase large subunit
MNVTTNKVFQILQESPKKISVMQGGTRCFTGETLVNCVDSYKQIKDIEIGDKVWSLDHDMELVIRPVVNKFHYKVGHHNQKCVTFVLLDNQKITCTDEHKLLTPNGYTKAIDIAERMLEADKWNKSIVLHIDNWQDCYDEIQEQKRIGCSSSNETSDKCQWVCEDNDYDEWENYDSEGAQISSGAFHTKSSIETTSESQKQQSSRQSSGELGMGNAQREHASHGESRKTDAEQWLKKWDGKIGRRFSKENQARVQAENSNDETLGGKVWCEKINYQGHTIGKDLAAHCLDICEVKEIIFHDTVEDVYDIEVAETHNFLVTQKHIISHNSGKTYNILTWFIVKLLQEKGKTLTICRSSLPSIKGSVMRDFIEILSKYGLYSEDKHNKSESLYFLGGNTVEFVSTDQPQKIRGRKRNYLFINEANEVNYESWMQLALRTTEKIVIDYNPSDYYSWIYEKVIPREDVDFTITTYKDNPFLEKAIIDEIERLKDADHQYWRVYGLGERAISEATIYTHWKRRRNFPEGGDIFYGLDFGFNNQTALVRVKLYDNEMYVDQLIYDTKMSTALLIDRMRALGLDRNSEIYADPAEPKTISEVNKAGFNLKSAVKDVFAGINKVKSFPLIVKSDSLDLLDEIKNYKWKTDTDGNTLDEPVKYRDHLMDAMRYAIYTKFAKPKRGWVV